MKTCLRIPRFLTPREDSETWGVIACDQYAADRSYWKRVAKEVGDTPSSLHMILPRVYWGEDDESAIEEIHENMYTALEQGWLQKEDRGLMLVERTTDNGVRYGILVCVDLEECSFSEGESSMVRAIKRGNPSEAASYLAVRRGAVLEFSHAVICYRDKKDKLVRSLVDEELEEISDCKLMQGGGRLKNYFIPDYIAEDVVQELQKAASPSFAIAEGETYLLAAKQYWDEIKGGLSDRGRRNHPARFAMAEAVNLYSEGVTIAPVHRAAEEVDTEAFCSFFAEHIPCKREGNRLTPYGMGGAECIRKTDELISAYLAKNEGRVAYTQSEEEIEDGVLIVMPAIGKEEIAQYLKKGKLLPSCAFSLGARDEKRFYWEGREISYD